MAGSTSGLASERYALKGRPEGGKMCSEKVPDGSTTPLVRTERIAVEGPSVAVSLQPRQIVKFYRVSTRKLWGDYGSILIGGMSRHLPRRDNLIQLERTGPFIPPITLPGLGDIVTTSDIKGGLEASSLAQFTFAPVLKARIVEYHWEQWDRTSDKPAEYPEGGEPESYILARPHSAFIAEQLGDLWEVILPEEAEVEGVRIGRGVWEYRVKHSTWRGSHLFRAKGKRHVIATEEAKTWMMDRAEDWLDFQEAQAFDSE